MGKQFQEHGRDLCHTAFSIGTVPDAPSCPVGIPQGTDVIDYLGLHYVCIIPGSETALTRWQQFCSITIAGIYGQSPNYAVVQGDTGIGVKSKGKVNRYLQAWIVRVLLRSAGQGIHPAPPGRIVIYVIMFTFIIGINRVGKSCPLQPVTSTFGKPGVIAHLGRDLNIAV